MSGQTVFQVIFAPSFLKSVFLHLWRSSAATGGSFHSFAAQIFIVCAGSAIGIPSIDICEVTSQESPISFAAGAVSAAMDGIDTATRSGIIAAKRRHHGLGFIGLLPRCEERSVVGAAYGRRRGPVNAARCCKVGAGGRAGKEGAGAARHRCGGGQGSRRV